MANRVLILFAHPAFQKSRVNRRLIAAVRNMESVTINDLYEEYPDFFVNINSRLKRKAAPRYASVNITDFSWRWSFVEEKNESANTSESRVFMGLFS